MRALRLRAANVGVLGVGVLAVALGLVACGGTPPAVRPRASVGETPTPSPSMLAQPTTVNGCDPAVAEFATASAVAPGSESGGLTIAFGGGTGQRYRPRCVAIGAGDAVHFLGNFAEHPMVGGAVIEGSPLRDPLSPLPFVSAGTEATFRADSPGVYPFYCQLHWILGMTGAIYVR